MASPEDLNENPGMNKPSLGKIPFHPFTLALYFVLSLLGLNISQLFPKEIIRSVLSVLAFAGLLVFASRMVLKDWWRGNLAASLILILFFTYGHVYNFLEKNIPPVGRHRVLIPIWILFAVLGLWWIARQIRKLLPITRAVNVAALVALAFPVFQIISWEIQQARSNENSVVSIPGIGNLTLAEGSHPPDVYFILLDMYARQDILQEYYGFDNSFFLDKLHQLGFQVIDCSQANYSQTELVLASILNMSYLDTLDQFDSSTKNTSVVRQYIKENAVMRAFRSMGFKLISFETGFHFSEFYYADHYLSPKSGSSLQLGKLNSYEVMLLKSTAIQALLDLSMKLPRFLVPDTNQPLETKREQIQFDFRMLETLPEDIAGPKFVFAHILVAHEPFVFTSDGSPVNYAETMDAKQYNEAYLDQIEFTNKRILPILAHLIEVSDPKPVIILQGDTGPGLVSHAGHVANLSAFYLPGYDQALSRTLSPVNNFRLVFNQYFGSDLELLPDYSNFSLYTAPFEMEPIQNSCPAEK